MRIRTTKILLFLLISLNLAALYIGYRVLFSPGSNPTSEPKITTSLEQRIGKLVTVLIRDFEVDDNDVAATVKSIVITLPKTQVIVLYDSLPYPPLNLSGNYIKTIDLSTSLTTSFMDRYPILTIATKYVLFVPDYTRIWSRVVVENMLNEISDGTVVVSPSGNDWNCLDIGINLTQWTITYKIKAPESTVCDAISDNAKSLILIETRLLKKLPEPFMLPFPRSLYIQTSLIQAKVKVIPRPSGKVPKSHKVRQRLSQRLAHMYSMFKIKQVVTESGKSDWYGCTRDIPRCFPPVATNHKPSYVYEGKCTPPCCLGNLRKTARHVFAHLDKVGVRYWLEAHSLLGALRSGDLFPWDHEVDVGFNRDDLGRSPWLGKARDRSAVDAKGFLWERAKEGHFYRVHYSRINRIYVNLFPFYLRNGSMVGDSWLLEGRRVDFRDSFLHPMSSVEFLGRAVACPNNIREFVEMKLGRGVVERAEMLC